jgi:integrase
MTNSSRARVPSYRRHKATGQAVVTLSGRDIYLGAWRSKESRREYDRIIAEWMAAGRCLPSRDRADLTVAELAAAYKRFAKGYYLRDSKGQDSYDHVRRAMRMLGEAYGSTRAVDFGPLAFKAMRERIATPERSWGYVNKIDDVIRRAFKWGASQELVPVSVFHGLQVVTGLKRGHAACRETAPVRPVDDATIEATLPHVPPVVADMVRLQRLTGARPAEVCIVRPCDVNTAGDVWEYRPGSNKNTHRGRDRVIFIGPKAQDVLRPYLLRPAEAYCFVPVESEQKRNAERRDNRKTKITPSQAKRRRKRNRDRAPGDRYSTHSYARAISRGVDVCNAQRQDEAKKQHRKAELLEHCACDTPQLPKSANASGSKGPRSSLAMPRRM